MQHESATDLNTSSNINKRLFFGFKAQSREGSWELELKSAIACRSFMFSVLLISIREAATI